MNTVRCWQVMLLSLLCLSVWVAESKADTVYLKNGRNISGLIKKQDKRNVELEVGFGTVTFDRKDIERISTSTLEETALIQEAWEKDKLKAREQRTKELMEPRPQRQQLDLRQEMGQIIVNVVLNRSVSASLLLDTGASVIVLSKEIGKKLGVDTTHKIGVAQLQLADGRKINAAYVILGSVNIQDIEVQNVDAAVLLDDTGGMGFKDGVLGMSFLKRFNFRVDQKNKKLILERLE